MNDRFLARCNGFYGLFHQASVAMVVEAINTDGKLTTAIMRCPSCGRIDFVQGGDDSII